MNDNMNSTRMISFTRFAESDSWLETALLVIYALPLITFVLISNSLVIYVLSVYESVKSPSNLLRLSLAANDVACGVLIMPIACFYSVTGAWHMGGVVCRVWNFFLYSLTTIAILHLCAIAVDRYLAITRPLTYGMNRSNRRSNIVIGIIWIGTFSLQAPPFLYDWAEKWPLVYEKETPCAVSLEYSIYYAITSLFTFYFPLLIILFIHVKLYLINRKRLKIKMKIAATKLVTATTMTINSRGPATKSSSNTQAASLKAISPNTAAEAKDVFPNSVITLVKGSKRRMMVVSTLSFLEIDENRDSGQAKSIFQSCQAISSSNQRLPHFNVCQRYSSPNNLIIAAEKSRLAILVDRERKSMLVTSLIVCSFIICYLPSVTIFVVMATNPSIHVSRWVILVVAWLAYTNSACNPVIYTIFNKDFKDAVAKFICSKTTDSKT